MGKRQEIKARQKRSQYIKQGLTIFAIVLVAVFFVGVLIYPSLKNTAATNELVIPETINSYKSSDMAIGDPNAPITVELFSDFQCPACGNFAQTKEENFINTYVSTGQVYFIFRPYSFVGDESVWATEAAYCALNQGNFWGFHDMIYYNMVGENTGAVDEARLTRYAKAIGLDTTEFTTCLASDSYLAQIQSDNDYAKESGVTGTPSFKIGDQIVAYNELLDIIDAKLSE